MKSISDIIKDEMDIYQKEKKKKKEEKDISDAKKKEEAQDNEKKDNDESKSDKLLFKDILKDEDDINDESRVVVKNEEDFVEVDGVKTISFSLDKELKEGRFDKNGNYIPNQEEEENEDNHTYSAETTEDEEDSSKVFLSSLEQLISLIPPQKNAVEALQASAKDNDRLNKITDCATNLLSLGETKIYTESIEELKEKLKSHKK